jgi:flagellar basal body P-ring formation protein FlgA
MMPLAVGAIGALTAVTLLVAGVPAIAETMVREQVRAGTILSAEMLDGDEVSQFVGMEARRTLWPKRPLSPRDVGPPEVVTRNALVEIVYHTGALELRGDGRALDAGGLGDRIRVINTDSRQVIRATISAPNQVSVSP